MEFERLPPYTIVDGLPLSLVGLDNAFIVCPMDGSHRQFNGVVLGKQGGLREAVLGQLERGETLVLRSHQIGEIVGFVSPRGLTREAVEMAMQIIGEESY